MEKITLKNYIFDNLLSKVEGISLKEIAELSSEITKTFTEFKKILVSSGIIKSHEKVSCAKKINHNNVDYLIIKKTSADYIIINLNTRSFLSNEDRLLFDKDFFINHFKERDSISYDCYSFESKSGSLNEVLDYFLRHQKILELDDLYISFSLEDEVAKTLVYYNITSGETVIHFKTIDNMSNDQIYLYDGFDSIDLQSNSFISKIPSINIPREKIPSFLLEEKIKKIQKPSNN